MAPVEINGRLLVDGGIANNLPIDQARQLCADVVIAVNISTPPLKREELNSALSVSLQLVNFLGKQTVDDQLKRMTDRDVLIATMTVAYKFLRESFTTRVTLDRASFLIRAEYVDGPFSHLENVWRFEPHGRGDCIIRFSIDYEFKSRLLQMLIGSLFERVFARYTEAFEARADAVYGIEGGARVSAG